MKVRLALGIVIAVLLPGLPAHPAQPPTKRVVSVTYTWPMGETTGRGAWLFGSHTGTATAQADEDKVTVGASDRGGPIALAIDLTRNGTTTRAVACAPMLISVNKGSEISATPLTGRCADGSVSVPMGGEVTFSFHKRKVATRRPAPAARPTAPKTPSPPQTRTGAPPELRWAVLIGINDYAGRTHSTVGGVGDIVAIRKALLAAGWRNDHILMVRDNQATAEGIRWAFDWLAKRSTPRTFSLFHFSGHVCIASRGPCASGHTYLWAHDNRFIPETEVRSRMMRVRGYSWLDIAACEAGAFDLHSASRLFSASSRGDETSYENPDWKLSYWTGLVWHHGFMRGLADNRRVAKQATIGEMLKYGRTHAPEMTRRSPSGSQHPVVAGGAGNWTLYDPPGG